jgi:hypothetical protein
MNLKNRMIRFIPLIIIALGLLFSCDIDNTEELEAEHSLGMASLKAAYNIEESDSIGDGIYLKILSEVGVDDTVISSGDGYVVVDLLGIDADNNAFDVTDADVADSLNVFRSDYVYGPLRVDVQNTFPGFYKVMKKLPEGADAIALYPHDQAFGGYTPILYEIKLYRVIEDIDAYIEEEFLTYRDSLGMLPEDTLSGYNNLYVKSDGAGDSVPEINYGSIVHLNFTARYAEVDEAYVESFPGREFFPINNSGKSIYFEYGTSYFPISEAVHVVLADSMRIGETREVLSPAEYVYGEDSYRHPTMGTIIVPTKMPVHYTIRLDSVSR